MMKLKNSEYMTYIMRKHEKVPLASGVRKPCEKTQILMQMASNRISLFNFM